MPSEVDVTASLFLADGRECKIITGIDDHSRFCVIATTTGKIERLHQTLRDELLTVHPPFETIADAQAAVDAWRQEYNATRPHQS